MDILPSFRGLAIRVARAPATRSVIPGLLAVFALLLAACSKSPEEVKAAKAVEIAQTTGSLLVKSNLAQAAIEARPVGGTTANTFKGSVGRPLTALPPGKYAVTAAADNWPDVHGEAEVSVGQTTEVTLHFPSGSLRLDSSPSGANVKLGATVLGKTPLTIAQMPLGDYPISVEYPGWPTVASSISITENLETNANVRLPHGKVMIDSIPSGATVLQGRTTIGRTPLAVDRVPAGSRKFILQSKDFPPLEITVTVTDREEVKVRPALGSVYPVLDPAELLRAVWVADNPGRIAPVFDSATGVYRPKNDIVKNVHRETLYNNWLRKTYRYAGAIKSYDPASGRVEFADQKSELSRYRVIAQVRPGVEGPVQKTGSLALYGRLTAVEEPAWPSRVITLELSSAELLPADTP